MSQAAQQQHPFQLPPEAVSYYIDHPVAFVEDQLRAKPDGHQRDALGAVARGDWPVVFAGHGVGKTALLAWIILWWLYTRPTAKIPITSTKKEQLGDNLWPEIYKWLSQSLLAEDFEWQKTKVFIAGQEAACFAVARTANTQEALQGFHDDHLLFIVEEASGVADPIFEPVLGALTNEGAVMVMVGNPTRSSGFFHDKFTHPTGRFVPIHIPCIEPDGTLHPRVSADYPKEIADTYGPDSTQYRVRVLGLPPTGDDDAVIPLEWVEQAAETEDIAVNPAYRRLWGLDVARFGDDRTCLCKRWGRVMPEPPVSWQKLDTMQVCGSVLREWQDTPREMRPHEIFVDDVGVGGGVADRLREMGLPATGVNVGRLPAVRSGFVRLRDELWHRAREWFRGRDVSIPASEARDNPMERLIAELTTLKQLPPTSDNKFRVEKKADMKERLPRIGSPDEADAFVLTFMDSVELVEDHEVDAYAVEDNDGDEVTWFGAW